MKKDSEIPNLAGHFEGVRPEDLLLIAFHNGRSYSVTKQDADFGDLDDDLMFELHYYAGVERASGR